MDAVVDHRGGYREVATRVPEGRTEPTASDAELRADSAWLIEHARGQLIVGFVVAFLFSWLMAPSTALVSLPLALLLFGRRVIAARHEPLARARGELVLTRGTWRFVDEDGTALRTSHGGTTTTRRWRCGPAVAHVHRTLGFALACTPIAVDEEQEVRLIQKGLDAFFGVDATDREELAQGRAPRRARFVWERSVREIEGPVYPAFFSTRGGPVPAILAGHQLFRSNCFEAHLLMHGDRARVFVTPCARTVIAIELIGVAADDVGLAWAPPSYAAVFDDFRARFH